jgi:hypothetical protein
MLTTDRLGAPLRSVARLASLAFLLAGCLNDPLEPIPGPEIREYWYGTYASTASPDSGVIVLDVTRVGEEVRGQLVFDSRTDDAIWSHLYVKGSGGASGYALGLDTDRVDYQFEFSLQASKDAEGKLTATFSHPEIAQGEIAATRLDVGGVAVESTLNLAESVHGLAHDGTNLWVSTAGHDHILLDQHSERVRQVAVFVYGAHWTSDSITSDGQSLWGHLPGSVIEAGNSRNVSNIYEFSKTGEILSEFQLGHRTRGLAYAGGELWSLRAGSEGLHRFDDSGAVLSSVDVALPDLVHLEFDGTHFWSLSWFLNVLYQIDRNGQVLRVYDLPKDEGLLWPTGIAFDGEFFWAASGMHRFVYSSRVYKLRLTP